MYAAISIHSFLTALIFWAYCGYLISLILLHRAGRPEPGGSPACSDTPAIAILIPCHNEENFIEPKVRNTAAIDYPADRLTVLFLDGNSGDATRERIREGIAPFPHMKLIDTGTQGKIDQLNAVLPGLAADLIVCTDADSELGPNVIRQFVSSFESDARIGIVGAKVVPRTNLLMEARYWEDQNIIRFLESAVHSSSIVIGPCYAFLRGLIEAYPPDCGADDVYISFIANLRGYQVRYLCEAEAVETRAPATLAEMIAHKYRKGSAYHREALRFLFLPAGMPGRWKLIFLTKALQVLFMPWILLAFGPLSLSLLMGSKPAPLIGGLNLAALLGSLVVTSRLMAGERSRRLGRKRRGSLIGAFLITNLVLLANGLTFPFVRRTSRYKKVGTP